MPPFPLLLLHHTGFCSESIPVALGSTPALEWATLVWDGGTRVPYHVAKAVRHQKGLFIILYAQITRLLISE